MSGAARDDRKEAMRARILRTADRLFYARGIQATGVDTVAAEVGISKRTLYNYFPSKEALVEAYLKGRYHVNGDSDAPALDQILRNFDRLARKVEGGGFRGCPFVNAVSEEGDPSRVAVSLAADFKGEQRDWAERLLRRAGVADPAGLADQIAVLVDGALVCAVVHRDARFIGAAREAARVLLLQAAPELERNSRTIPTVRAL